MKTHRCTMTLVLAAGAWHAAGQTAIDFGSQGRLRTGTTLPAKCTVGQVFFKTDAASGANVYACATPNNWSVMGLPVLGGDAAGTQQSVTVKGLQGRGVSAASPADQNVLRWNAGTGQWEPGPVSATTTTGTAGPPPTCAAGSLYLRSDAANNIQQLYVCANTNTWTMASTGSGLAASQPVNCVVGQTWLSTDTGTMTYCSVTGSPGTWSTTFAGNTIRNGAGAPSAGTGANGDFYLDTAASCLYGPKASGAWPGSCTSLAGGPNFSATSGTATTTATYGATGLMQTYVDPNVTGSDPNRQAKRDVLYFSGLNQPGNYSNDIGHNVVGIDFNGNNSPDNTDKRTKAADIVSWAFRGSGQKFGRGTTVYCPSMGDCGGMDVTVFGGGHNNAWGDEGVIGFSARLIQPPERNGTINSVAAATCNTTTTSGIAVKSGDHTETKTVSVADATNCHVGDLITIDQGQFSVSDSHVEIVKLTGVSGGVGGSISALFAYTHPSGAPVQPSSYLNVAGMDFGASIPDDGGFGQGRLVILSSYTPVSAGNVTGISCSGAACTVTGDSSTAWSTAMVGGNTNLAGCISLDADNFTSTLYSTSGHRAWYPIYAVAGAHNMTIWNYNGAAASGTYTYQIVPCGRIGYLDLSANATALTVVGVVLESNSFTWSVGGTLQQPIDPLTNIQHGILSMSFYDRPVGVQALFRAANAGTAVVRQGFLADGPGPNGLAGKADYMNAFVNKGVTSNGSISVTGKDLYGELIGAESYVGDDKRIDWAGAGHDNGSVYAGTTGQGFVIDNAGNGKLRLSNSGLMSSVTLDYSAYGNSENETITIPRTSGMIGLVNPGGPLLRTLQSVGGAVDIGYYSYGASGSTRLGFNLWLSTNNSAGTPHSTYYQIPFVAGPGGAGGSPDNLWYVVPPTGDVSGLGGSGYALEMQDASDYTVHFRLRSTSGTAGGTAYVYLNQIGGPYVPFTASTATSTPSAPTSWWPASVITQTANKMTLTNATGFTTTIDNSANTAARTITLPNVGGTPLLYQGNTTGSTAFAPAGSNCPATNCVTPYTWMQVTTADGSTAYMPVFK